MSKELFQRLLQDFREAWCRYGDKAFDIEVFAPSRGQTLAAQSNPDEGPECELDKPMFSFDEYELIAPVALPCDSKQEITSDQRNSTLFGMAVAQKRAGTAEARNVFKRLCGEAGAALPPDFFSRLRGLVPWYMTEPAAWWLALLVALSGQSAYSSDGRYVGKAALIRPFLLSINAIQVCGLNTDSPRWPVGSSDHNRGGGAALPAPAVHAPRPVSDANNFAPRLRVSLDPPQASLDGTHYALRQDGAILLRELLEAEGEWVTGAKLDMRVDRVKKRLPAPLRRLIEAQPGKGHRIPRKALA